MPGAPSTGMRCCQEVAPSVAMARAEIVNPSHALETPAGEFLDCLRTKEGSSQRLNERDFRTYEGGIGSCRINRCFSWTTDLASFIDAPLPVGHR